MNSYHCPVCRKKFYNHELLCQHLAAQQQCEPPRSTAVRYYLPAHKGFPAFALTGYSGPDCTSLEDAVQQLNDILRISGKGGTTKLPIGTTIKVLPGKYHVPTMRG